MCTRTHAHMHTHVHCTHSTPRTRNLRPRPGPCSSPLSAPGSSLDNQAKLPRGAEAADATESENDTEQPGPRRLSGLTSCSASPREEAQTHLPLQGLAPTGPHVDGPALARPGPRVLSHGREVPLGPIPAPPPERRADPPPPICIWSARPGSQLGLVNDNWH